MSSLSLKPASSYLLDPSQPVRSLSIGFWLWKALLLIIIICCPGLGYDTSSSLLPSQGNGSVDVISSVSLSIPLKFVRWDSIYFVHIARSGHVFEQEWAFSSTYSNLVNSLSSFLFRSDDSSGAAKLAVTAVALSHVAHYLSVLVLYRLSINVFGHDTERRRLLCFLSAVLHIISPAGAFLSAPYGESLFSFLNISGFYLYSSSRLDLSTGKHALSHGKLLLSGCLFAVATAVRSNGILSGVLLAYDALEQSYEIVSQRSLRAAGVRLYFVILSGCIVALGLVVPQYLAYVAYCTNEGTSRPWCQSLVPSIYGWVQAHYWDVGFLRYWTVSNLPLFLLASPMLLILFLSCFWALGADVPFALFRTSSRDDFALSSSPAAPLLTQLAIAQLILAAMAIISYHIQIINRVSSGYPLWYWFLVWQALGTSTSDQSKVYRALSLTIVQVMATYALVQAAFFGSFLPPA
ncbi:GPI mannosyltransferase 2 [Aspergillus cavernicola]|uniref:GPI mannosyltransferase 2 n=1 Tax=Aspergillus cavernicola TaxID=176166 RepID=A0ABR4I9K1_9EURO